MRFQLLIFLFSFSIYSANLFYVKGRVYINEKLSGKGTILKNNDVVKTDLKSLAIISTKSGSKIKLDEKSKLTLKDIDKEIEFVDLSLGQAFFNIVKKNILKNNHIKFKVKTNSTVMGVRGTEFFASYGKNNDIWMCVNEGIVTIKAENDSKETSVKKGEGVLVKNGKETSEPRPLPWTKNLNWSMNPSEKDLANKIKIQEAYKDELDYDYD